MSAPSSSLTEVSASAALHPTTGSALGSQDSSVAKAAATDAGSNLGTRPGGNMSSKEFSLLSGSGLPRPDVLAVAVAYAPLVAGRASVGPPSSASVCVPCSAFLGPADKAKDTSEQVAKSRLGGPEEPLPLNCVTFEEDTVMTEPWSTDRGSDLSDLTDAPLLWCTLWPLPGAPLGPYT